MVYKTILVEKNEYSVSITINRLKSQNSINTTLLEEIQQVFDDVEGDSECRVVFLLGQPGFFCTGMDFEDYSQSEIDESAVLDSTTNNPYMRTLKRFSLSPKIVISVVNGKVMAGGVGIVSASDLVISTGASQFSLSEMLWGLLPAMVTPFLIRRVGFQLAYRLTLTTLPIGAQEALQYHLVDFVDDDPQKVIRSLGSRLSRMDEQTVRDLKNYYRKMWFLTEGMESLAVEESVRLSKDPRVVKNINNFVKYQKFPWDKDTE